MADPFAVKDCALISIATGKEAQNLRELSDRLETIHPGCIYYHFWGGMLRSSFDEPEYQNDFAAWAWRNLHDTRLAERLAIIDPTHYKDIEDLRRELIDVIEERLAESEFVPWARAGQRFKFIRSQIVVFDTGIRLDHPRGLQERIPKMSLGSIFYHFIDARRRTERGKSDFVEWLQSFGEDAYDELIKRINSVDPYFTTLAALRKELEAVFKMCPMEG
ncbi:DUF5752 family protein [Desulforhabdus amnigena]|uniref:Uncharacterized protein n=1 Tax=Desulforhabdus amnigena TaxID=40218 RepID=A0A9W6D209_9BACT|nr:DUF5752 family protein [Desulforhabdus amnigena]GLI34410.1 hypothetical protein DAMNIGENAA_18430 [Desulforhabdus amnigena]